MTKLIDASKKAAELLGIPNVSIYLDTVRYEVETGVRNTSYDENEAETYYKTFSIANPSDRDAVVQMLGERYSIVITPLILCEGKEFIGWAWDDYNDLAIDKQPQRCDTYQDAVVAAVLALTESRPE